MFHIKRFIAKNRPNEFYSQVLRVTFPKDTKPFFGSFLHEIMHLKSMAPAG